MTDSIGCMCGQVKLTLVGAPIICAECYCTSCRQAGARLGAMPNSPRYLTPLGGTPFVLQRKDRITFEAGVEHLRDFRVSPKATTRRVVASCCNTPIFLEFKGGHWLSLYACLWPEATRPPMTLRAMVRDLPVDAMLPDDLPNKKTQSFAFVRKLLGAWVAMGFRAPKNLLGRTPLDSIHP